MSIMRVHKTKNYTVMCNYHFKEKEMSLKAKGLLSQMLSLPDNWNYSIAGLVALNKENETAIKSALNELKEFGYLKITKLTPADTSSGKYEYQYDIYEKPQNSNSKQDGENLPVENLPVENQGQLNTKESKELNTKELNIYNDIGVMRENSNINNLDNKNSIVDNSFFSGIADKSASIPKTPASPPSEEKPKKKKGGLAPLYDMVDKKFPSSKYYNLNAALKTYLKAYVGIRRIPDVDKWEDMLNRLEQYSSVVVPGASGLKFIESRALEIVDKARNGKNGIPYLDFDDVYHSTELKEPTFNLNRDFIKGY